MFDGKKAIRGGIPFVFRKLFNFDLNRRVLAQGVTHRESSSAASLFSFFELLCCQSPMMDDDRFRLAQLSPTSPQGERPKHKKNKRKKIESL